MLGDGSLYNSDGAVLGENGSWAFVISGIERNEGPSSCSFTLALGDSPFTEGDKTVTGIVLTFKTGDDGEVYESKTGAKCKISRVEKWSTVEELGLVTTKYLLDGTFSGPLTPLTGGSTMTFENASFKNLVLIDIQKEEG